MAIVTNQGIIFTEADVKRSQELLARAIEQRRMIEQLAARLGLEDSTRKDFEPSSPCNIYRVDFRSKVKR